MDTQEKKTVTGILSDEIEVKVTAAEAWKVYGTMRLSETVAEKFPDSIQKIEILEGDGGVGTVFKIFFVPGNHVSSGLTCQIEKIIELDNEKRMKLVEVIEGGYLAAGFTKNLVRFQVLEKDENSCITKASLEYEIPEDASDKIYIASVESFVATMNVIADTLTKAKKDV